MNVHASSPRPPACLTRRITLALLGALSLAVLPTKADAQPRPSCAPRDQVLRQLEREFGETPVALGIARAGDAVIEVLASDGGATFTLILSLPNGQSCLLAMGTDWQFVFGRKGKGA